MQYWDIGNVILEYYFKIGGYAFCDIMAMLFYNFYIKIAVYNFLFVKNGAFKSIN